MDRQFLFESVPYLHIYSLSMQTPWSLLLLDFCAVLLNTFMTNVTLCVLLALRHIV